MNAQKDYWDRKIKEWSEASYQKKTKSLIEKAASLFRGGITGRMDVALKIVGPKAKGKTIMDIGCGVGDFCFAMTKYQPEKIIGIDISQVAVKEAQKRAKIKKLDKVVTFIQADIANVKKLPKFDIAVGLGFIDYFNKEELKKVFKVLSGRYFLFSMFEKKISLLNILHAFYVRVQNCPGSYKYSRKEMTEIVPKEAGFYFLEKNGLLFITNLPN